MNVCEACAENGGDRFVKDVVPGSKNDMDPGWELDYELNPVAVEQEQEAFFEQVSDLLTSLIHKTLKDANGNDMKVLVLGTTRHTEEVWYRSEQRVE
jgi:hypothetical protein